MPSVVLIIPVWGKSVLLTGYHELATNVVRCEKMTDKFSVCQEFLQFKIILLYSFEDNLVNLSNILP